MAIIMRFQCKRQKFSGVASQLVRGHALTHQIRYSAVVRIPDIEGKIYFRIAANIAKLPELSRKPLIV
jgi:hypothetical protein